MRRLLLPCRMRGAGILDPTEYTPPIAAVAIPWASFLRACSNNSSRSIHCMPLVNPVRRGPLQVAGQDKQTKQVESSMVCSSSSSSLDSGMRKQMIVTRGPQDARQGRRVKDTRGSTTDENQVEVKSDMSELQSIVVGNTLIEYAPIIRVGHPRNDGRV